MTKVIVVDGNLQNIWNRRWKNQSIRKVGGNEGPQKMKDSMGNSGIPGNLEKR